MKVWLLIFVLLTAIGCAPEAPQEVTKAKISLGASVAIQSYPGGLFFYAQHRDSDARRSIRLQRDTEEVELPNGTWDFTVIGWEGDNGASSTLYTGVTKCGRVNGKKLDGEDTSVTFTLSTDQCNSPLYKGGITSADANGFKPIHFHSCTNIRDHIATGKSLPAGMTNCQNEKLGKSQSFRVALFEFSLSKNPLNHLGAPHWSKCYNNGAAFDVNSLNLRLPTGNLETDVTQIGPNYNGPGRFPVLVQSFEDTSCTVGAQTHLFPNGLGGRDYKNGGAIFDNGTGGIALFLHDDMCSGTWGSDPSINGPNVGIRNGTDELNYICNPDQLFDIVSNANANYVLGRDLFFDTTPRQPINITFQGDLSGNGHAVNNLIIEGTNAYTGLISGLGDGASIRDIVFNNLSVSTNYAWGGGNLGAITGSIAPTTNNPGIHLENITINGLSLSYNDDNLTGSNVGGLAGQIMYTGGRASFWNININNANIHAISSLNPLDPNFKTAAATGGIVGLAGPSASCELVVEESHFSGNITAGSNTGGLFGKISSTPTAKVRITNSSAGKAKLGVRTNINYIPQKFGSTFNTNFEANVGGLVGIMNSGVIEKSSSFAQIDIQIPYSVSDSILHGGNNIGGIVGVIENGDVRDSATNIIIETSAVNGAPMHAVGGIIGMAGNDTCGGGANYVVGLRNVSSKFESYITSGETGGLVGIYKCPTNPLASDPLINFVGVGSVVDAIIHHEAGYENHSNNVKRGGAFGVFGQGTHPGFARMIIAKSDITGKSELGGLAGAMVGNNTVNENVVISNITNTNGNANETHSGGAVGRLYSVNSVESKFNNNFVSANIYHTAAISVSTSSSGKLIGRINLLADFTIPTSLIEMQSNIYATTTYNNSLQQASTDKIASYSGPIGTEMNNFNTVNTSASAMGNTNWIDSSFNSNNALPKFLDKALAFGGESSTNLFPARHGTFFNDFLIGSCNKFNLIQDNEYLLIKSYKLTAPIDFNSCGGAFNPIGEQDFTSPANLAFSGIFKSNGYALKNITINVPSPSENVGIFRKLEAAEIGSYEDPFLVDNIIINHSGNDFEYVGTITGQSLYSHISAKVTKATISSSGGIANDIGGLVGILETNSSISNSTFQGSIILAGNESEVGGIAGRVFLTGTDRVWIEKSSAKLSQLYVTGSTTPSLVGGLIGYVDAPSTATVDIKESFAWFDRQNNSANDTVFGIDPNGFGGLIGSPGLGIILMNLSYADVIGASTKPSSLLGTAPVAASQGDHNMLINGSTTLAPAFINPSSIYAGDALNHSEAQTYLKDAYFYNAQLGILQYQKD